MSNIFIKKIISGGQTGVDRAALDIAMEFNIPHGGWCPYERKAEDGEIPFKYNLKEAPAPTNNERSDSDAIYKIRTELNARDSDGTLIILQDTPIGGTLYTIQMVAYHKKPYYLLNLSENFSIADVASWVKSNNIRELNIAGPRASQAIGIYDSAYNILFQILNHELLNLNKCLVDDKYYRHKL